MKFLALLFLSLSALIANAQQQTFTVLFEDNRSDLTFAEKARLENFIATGMSGVCSNGGFKLQAHTDSRGSKEYNMVLAEKRLATVRDYFVKPNVRVCFAGLDVFGEDKLVTQDNGDVAAGAVNRRVEIIYNKPVIEEKNDIVDTTELVMTTVPPVTSVADVPQDLTTILSDTAIKKGSVLTLKSLEFYGGRHLILPPSFLELKTLVTAMQENPKLKIALEGHICCEPTRNDGFDLDLQTRDLSLQRAKAVNDFLVYSGISQRRISYRGYGHKRPLYEFPERSELERSANRRVEVRIVDK